MTGLDPDAQRWREWIRSRVDSLFSLDGESALEFVESAALALADELKRRQPEPQTASELIMAGFLAAFQEAAAEAYIDVQRPRSEIEQILRNRLEDLYRESEPWAVNGLSHEEVATKRDAYEKEIERSNAKASDSVPEARRKRITKMDFNELLTAQGSDTRMAIFEIARVISPELLAFTLNVSATDVHDHIPDDTQRAVIGELAAILPTLPGYPYNLVSGAIADALLKYDEALGTSKVTHFHTRCGGERPEIVDDGSFDSALQIVAIDLIGARLCNYSSLMNVLPSHPLQRELIVRTMGEDEPVAELFRSDANADSDLSDAERHILSIYLPPVIAYWSDGSGGSIEIRDIPEHILAAINLSCDTTDGVLQKVCEAVQESLALARALVTGNAATTIALVGLANVSLDHDLVALELPGMRIRHPSPFDSNGVPYATKPTAIAEIDTQLRLMDVVAQSPLPNDDPHERLREFAAERDRLSVHAPERRRSFEAVAEGILQMRFAMALASQQRRLIGPIWLYTVYRNPLTGWGGNSLRPSSDISSAFSSQVIDRITADRIAKYFVASGSIHPSLRLARARILRALSERDDPTDSFIDFVIAWESMVGYAENTTFLVSAAMAKLLSPDDAEKRKDLFSRIKKLYANRSSLVHGSAGPDLQTKSFKIAEVRDYAEQAGRFAIDMFKRVLERPDLMKLDAQQRVRMVLLDFA
jgi:hypothetical protein